MGAGCENSGRSHGGRLLLLVAPVEVFALRRIRRRRRWRLRLRRPWLVMTVLLLLLWRVMEVVMVLRLLLVVLLWDGGRGCVKTLAGSRVTRFHSARGRDLGGSGAG